MSIISEMNIELVKQYAKESISMREFQIKLGYAQNGSNSVTITKFCEENGISLDHFTGLAKDKIVRTPENVFIENSTANQTTLRRWYEKGKYTEYKCSICGQEPFWNGKELTLTLDHINGINNDDRLVNLRWVCPNCDRQLDTFCSKNNHKERVNKAEKFYCKTCGKEISRGAIYCETCYGLTQRTVDRPDADTLNQILLDNNGNFTAVGKIYGVTDNAVRKWCKAYNMSHLSSSYKSEENKKQINHTGKSCVALDKITKEVLYTFPCVYDAATYVFENKLSTASMKSITSHICAVCNNQRNSAYGFSWRYIE